jgi:hypothetical protein
MVAARVQEANVTAKKLVWLLVLSGCGRSGGDAPQEGGTTLAEDADTGSAPGNTTNNPDEGSTGANSNGMSGEAEEDDDATSVGETGADDDADSTGSDVPSDELSDEFDDPARLSQWTIRHEDEGTPNTIEELAVAGGRLLIRPLAGGWYGDYVGAMLYKPVSGDFIVETHVQTVSRADGSSPPSLPFNSGGLIVRDPASAPGNQNWLTNNVGFQSASVATEGKTTVGSHSELFLRNGTQSGILRICRFGSTFVLARRLEGEDAFIETHRFDRPDLPDQVQVGMMANGWNSTGGDPDTTQSADVDASFDYVRFWVPEAESDCLAD